MRKTAEKKKPYSEQFLEKLQRMESDSIETYGRFCFLEGKWMYAYWIEKCNIEKELHALAREHGLIKPDEVR